MLLTQSAEKGCYRIVAGAAGQAIGRGAAHTPARVAEGLQQKGVVLLFLGQHLGRVHARGFVGAVQRFGQFQLAFQARGHIFDGHDGADDAHVFPQRCDRHVLLHAIEAQRWRPGPTGDQVMVKGRRQHFHGALVDDPPETIEQLSRF